jgi:hypothetical protein
VTLAFAHFVVFADRMPDLVRLLNELLPLVSPAPEQKSIYEMYGWRKGDLKF